MSSCIEFIERCWGILVLVGALLVVAMIIGSISYCRYIDGQVAIEKEKAKETALIALIQEGRSAEDISKVLARWNGPEETNGDKRAKMIDRLRNSHSVKDATQAAESCYPEPPAPKK